MDAIWAVRPARTLEELTEALRAAMKHAAENGVTSVQDLPGNARDLEAWEKLRERGELTVRVNYRPSLTEWEKARDRRAAMKNDEWLRIGGVKGYADGSLGSGTALFFEPYDDEPGNRGVFAAEAIPLATMEERVAAADAGRPPGRDPRDRRPGQRRDPGRLRARREANGPRDRRFRIEHAQHLRAADIPRFAGLGVIASMQPYHAIDDGRWAEKRIGRERARTTYAFRSLLDAKAVLAFGSDWDVAPLSPLAGIFAAVTRRTIDGKNPGRLGPRAEDHGRRGAAGLHGFRGLGRLRGEREGDSLARKARGLRRPGGGPPLRQTRGDREDRGRYDRRRRQNRFTLPLSPGRGSG